ncbi:MAG: sugar phosphate nucleotidyltransferase [Candidatus Pacebacteria bacterium]|nr:sugar phosphate nucleotidyltransferase [Candidatus Paceibacterota bacterium]
MKNKNKKCIIDTAVIPIAGLGTRFLPLSKIIPKELFPLGVKPVVQYVVEEALEAGVKKIIFIISPKKRDIFKRYILGYFKKDEELISILKERKKEEALYELKCIPRVKYEYVVQRKPKGDGDAILKVEKLVGKKPFLVLFGDDISLPCYPRKSKEGIISEGMANELVKTYSSVRSPVLCLYKMQKDRLSSYGVPKIKEVKDRMFQILDLIEKPKPKEAPSNFALVGKYVLTPDIFYFLKKTEEQNGEIILANALKEMIRQDKKIFGFATKNKWIECGTKEKWIENFKYFTK